MQYSIEFNFKGWGGYYADFSIDDHDLCDLSGIWLQQCVT